MSLIDCNPDPTVLYNLRAQSLLERRERAPQRTQLRVARAEHLAEDISVQRKALRLSRFDSRRRRLERLISVRIGIRIRAPVKCVSPRLDRSAHRPRERVERAEWIVRRLRVRLPARLRLPLRVYLPHDRRDLLVDFLPHRSLLLLEPRLRLDERLFEVVGEERVIEGVRVGRRDLLLHQLLLHLRHLLRHLLFFLERQRALQRVHCSFVLNLLHDLVHLCSDLRLHRALLVGDSLLRIHECLLEVVVENRVIQRAHARARVVGP